MIKEVVPGGPQKVYQLTYKVPTKVVPPVNGFLVLADVPILIDGGASDEDTYQEFHKDLASIGLKASDLGAVIVTHNHIDHIGLASRLAADNPNLKVQCHEDEWYMVAANDEGREELRDILCSVIVTWGVPRDVTLIMREKIAKALRFGGGIPLTQLIPFPKGPYKVGGVTFEAIHTPGHTDGLVCLWWPERGILFSNDQVLEDITPNPTIYLKPRNDRRCGLADYLESLKDIEDLPAKFLLPGHGDVFTNLKGKVAEIRQLALERQDRVLKNLRAPDQEPVSIIELTQKVWGEMDPINTFLGAREIHGYMEMLTDQGIVQAEIVGDTSFYSLTKKSVSTDLGYNEKDTSL